jgi:hypothetical protein
MSLIRAIVLNSKENKKTTVVLIDFPEKFTRLFSLSSDLKFYTGKKYIIYNTKKENLKNYIKQKNIKNTLFFQYKSNKIYYRNFSSGFSKDK